MDLFFVEQCVLNCMHMQNIIKIGIYWFPLTWQKLAPHCESSRWVFYLSINPFTLHTFIYKFATVKLLFATWNNLAQEFGHLLKYMFGLLSQSFSFKDLDVPNTILLLLRFKSMTKLKNRSLNVSSNIICVPLKYCSVIANNYKIYIILKFQLFKKDDSSSFWNANFPYKI